MMETDLDLKAGDIVLVDFAPVRGHEQDGTRPALVMTEAVYNEQSSFVIICPITSNPKPWPFKMMLPPGLKVSGFVMLDQIKSVDQRRRILRHLDTLPAEYLFEMRWRLGALLALPQAHAG